MRGWHRSSWQAPWARTLTTPRKTRTRSSRNILWWAPWTSVALQSCCHNKIPLQLWFNHVLHSTDTCDYPKSSLRNLSAPRRQHLFPSSPASSPWALGDSPSRPAQEEPPSAELLPGHSSPAGTRAVPPAAAGGDPCPVTPSHPNVEIHSARFLQEEIDKLCPAAEGSAGRTLLQLTKPCPWLSFRIWLLFHIYLKQTGWQITVK